MCLRVYVFVIPHVKHRCLFLLNKNIIQLYTYECIKFALRLNGNVRSVLSFLSSRARNIATHSSVEIWFIIFSYKYNIRKTHFFDEEPRQDVLSFFRAETADWICLKCISCKIEITTTFLNENA